MQPIRLECKYEQFTSLLNIPNFDLLIMMAVGSRDSLHREVAAIYREKREVYYEFFKKSPYYKDQRLASLSVQNYRAIQQFIGIYLFEQSVGSEQTTLKLIKKGYRFVYNFVKNSLKVDFYKLRDQYIEYVKKNVMEKNIHSAHLFGIALYLCGKMDKSILFDDFDVNLIKNSIEQVFLDMEVILAETDEAEEFVEQYRKKNSWKKNFSLPLKDLIVSINRQHSEEETSKEGEEQPVSHDFYKGLSKVALMLQYSNINPLDLQNITNIDQEKMKEIVSLSLSAIEMFELDEAPHSLLGTYLLIYALSTDYNRTKHDLIVTSQEEAQQDLFNLKKDYEGKLRLIEKEEEQKNKRIEQLEGSNNRLIERVQELEKQLLKKEAALYEQNEKIRRFESEQKKLQEQLDVYKRPAEKEVSIEEMAEAINHHQCVIVGGLKSWQEQLKEYIPSARFIEAEELNLNFDFLLSADVIFFNEAVNSHAMYQKIKSKLENSSVLFCYSGRNTNMYHSLKKIYEAVRGGEKE